MQNPRPLQTQPQWYHVQYPDRFPVRCEHDFITPATNRQTHIHTGLELGVCHSGTGIFAIEQKVIPFGPGDVFIITHLEAHYAHAKTDARWDWMYFEPAQLLGNILESPAPLDVGYYVGKAFHNRFPKDTYPVLHQLLTDMVHEWDKKSPYYSDKIKALLMEFLVELRRVVPVQQSKPKPPVHKLPANLLRLKKALDMITSDYEQSLRIEDLAHACKLSTGQFRTLFMESLGKNPKEYLDEYRISMACKRLKNTGDKILTIALECGYPTLSSFNRQFKHKTGISPHAWRHGGES